MHRPKRPASFRQGLTITFALGVSAAVLATTLVSVLLVHILLTRQFRSQALAEAALAARESLYPLLGAPSEAHHTVEKVLRWPDVTYVALDDASSGRRVAEAGQRPDSRLLASNTSPSEAVSSLLAVETKDFCLVIAPLLSAPTTAPFGELPAGNSPQRLGELRMVFSKAVLHQLSAQIGLSCSCAGVLIALLILLWVAMRIRALTVPLARLAGVMEHQDNPGGRANINGVSEVQRIAFAYNRLMERVDQYTEGLERTVEQRTRELRLASESAQQAERAKSALLQASAHELKMPLHLIELQVRTVLHELEFVDRSAEPARRALAAISAAANELLSRIVKMLDAARSAGATRVVVKETFGVADFAEALRERTSALARSQNDEFVVRWSGSAVVHTDREKVFEIASELCLNACKFTKDGEVRLSLEVRDEMFCIDVADTGPGIPESERELIWLEFQRGSAASNPTYPGQGLGLCMVRQFVETLGGSIVMSSNIGRGAHFHVTIPLLVSDEPVTA
jgi:signal transduction histidine kinase